MPKFWKFNNKKSDNRLATSKLGGFSGNFKRGKNMITNKIITINGIFASFEDISALQKNIANGLDKILFIRYGKKIINIITL